MVLFARTALLVSLTTFCLPAWAAKACKGHGGVEGCDSNGRVLCKDGKVDTKFTCKWVTQGKKKQKQVLKFEKQHTQRGQILEPGQPPPTDTLQESHREMNK